MFAHAAAAELPADMLAGERPAAVGTTKQPSGQTLPRHAVATIFIAERRLASVEGREIDQRSVLAGKPAAAMANLTI